MDHAPAPDTNSAIHADRIAFRYAATEAVIDVSLDVRAATVHAVLGPNGAGKTTTIDMLAGLKHPSQGSVRVLGEDPGAAAGQERLRQLVGLVPQSGGHYPQLTVEETVRMHVRLYRSGDRPEALLEAVGLTHRADRRYARLSGGEQRRVDLAVALAGDPQLLILDEPTTGFDPEARERMWDLIRGLRAAGRTILLTTHYLEEAQALADEVTVIVDGRTVASGGAQQLAQRLGLRSRVDASIVGAEPPGELLDGANWGGEISCQDGHLKARVEDPLAYLAQLHAWSQSVGASIDELAVRPATLEDTYRKLVTTTDGAVAVEEAVR